MPSSRHKGSPDGRRRPCRSQLPFRAASDASSAFASTDRSTDIDFPASRDDGTKAMASGDESGQAESKEQEEQQQQEEELDSEIMSMSLEEIRQ